jgi:hypothetical protein
MKLIKMGLSSPKLYATTQGLWQRNGNKEWKVDNGQFHSS